MKIHRYSQNQSGRDWIVGDIHGYFSVLENALAKVAFDREKDRLFCVGDLVDRGPESARVLEFIRKPWFFSVRGNHDLLPMIALRGLLKEGRSALDQWIACGGDWFYEHNISVIAGIANELNELPLMIEIETPNGLIGVTHAEPKIGVTWQSLGEKVESECASTMDDLAWGRWRMMDLAEGGYKRIPEEWSIAGVDHLFMGHSIVPHRFVAGNIHFIDTGVFSPDGKLTLVDITEQGFREFSFNPREGRRCLVGA